MIKSRSDIERFIVLDLIDFSFPYENNILYLIYSHKLNLDILSGFEIDISGTDNNIYKIGESEYLINLAIGATYDDGWEPQDGEICIFTYECGVKQYEIYEPLIEEWKAKHKQ